MDDGSDDGGIWKRISRLFHGRADTVEQAILEADKDGELDKEERSMLLSVLRLDEVQVQDIMTPRTDIACMPDSESIRDLAELIVSTGHSRIPIFSESRDNIIGIVHAKDLLEDLTKPDDQKRRPSEIMRDPFFVPETKNALDLLHEFRSRKVHLAIILDEYGGTAGLVTIEDVLEQIVGEIEDEHDVPHEEEINRQSDGSYLINGRTYLDDLNENLGLGVKSDAVDTLGGYLTHLAGHVPVAGETFVLNETREAAFTVVKSDPKQIHCVRLVLSGREKSPEDEENGRGKTEFSQDTTV
ncbi:MAG: hemolysin family protein [Desulfovibrio sp.]|nr:hemolysin family protein [Desulfovibrio sp.]